MIDWGWLPTVPIHSEFFQLILVAYAISIVSYFGYLHLYSHSAKDWLVEVPILGWIVRLYLWGRRRIQRLLLRFLLYFVTDSLFSQDQRETINNTAIESFLLLFVFISSIISVEYFLLTYNVPIFGMTSVSDLNISNQLKAIGSLFLAWEAVIAGANQLSLHADSESETSKIEISLEQKMRQYSLRFSGALGLAVGYGFSYLSEGYFQLAGFLGIPWEPHYSLIIGVSAVFGIERTLTNFLGVSAFILLAITMPFFYVVHPTILMIAVVIWILFSWYSRRFGYPGLYEIYSRHSSVD